MQPPKIQKTRRNVREKQYLLALPLPRFHLPLPPAISLPLSTVYSGRTVGQCDLKWYILGVENILPSFNCSDLILSERRVPRRGGGKGFHGSSLHKSSLQSFFHS